MKTGIMLIAEERLRQIAVEGWTAEHNAEHDQQELALAAACYVIPKKDRERLGVPGQNWPWYINYWKPSENRIKELIKAGALIAAEIDRLQKRDLIDILKTSSPHDTCQYCGSIGWTLKEYGIILHKQNCPQRKGEFHQGNPPNPTPK